MELYIKDEQQVYARITNERGKAMGPWLKFFGTGQAASTITPRYLRSAINCELRAGRLGGRGITKL